MAPQQTTWGNATFTFSRPVFLSGFQSGRDCFYWEQEGPRSLSDEELLTVIAAKDSDGHFQIDLDLSMLDHPQDGIEELLRTLIGYLSAPLLLESAEERSERFSYALEMVESL